MYVIQRRTTLREHGRGLALKRSFWKIEPDKRSGHETKFEQVLEVPGGLVASGHSKTGPVAQFIAVKEPDGEGTSVWATRELLKKYGIENSSVGSLIMQTANVLSDLNERMPVQFVNEESAAIAKQMQNPNFLRILSLVVGGGVVLYGLYSLILSPGNGIQFAPDRSRQSFGDPLPAWTKEPVSVSDLPAYLPELQDLRTIFPQANLMQHLLPPMQGQHSKGVEVWGVPATTEGKSTVTLSSGSIFEKLFNGAGETLPRSVVKINFSKQSTAVIAYPADISDAIDIIERGDVPATQQQLDEAVRRSITAPSAVLNYLIRNSRVPVDVDNVEAALTGGTREFAGGYLEVGLATDNPGTYEKIVQALSNGDTGELQNMVTRAHVDGGGKASTLLGKDLDILVVLTGTGIDGKTWAQQAYLIRVLGEIVKK